MDTDAATGDLSVNLDDLDDIRRKLPRVAKRVNDARSARDAAKARLEVARGDAAEAEKALERWLRLFAGLQALVPEPAPHPPGSEVEADEGGPVAEASSNAGGNATSVEIVVHTVNEEGGEIPTREVRERVASHGLADDTVSWALWKASSLGLIRKIKRGRYAPLDAAPEQSELAVSSNGTAPDETTEPAPDAGVQTQ